MDTFTITGVTQDQVNALIEKLQRSAVVSAPQPNRWDISGHGITATANYLPETSTLTVSVKNKPWYISLSTVESTLRENL
jgi:hypothetical protein